MKRYSFYHKDTGAIHGSVFATDDVTQLARNTPADHVAIEGNFDYRNERFDLSKKAVVDFVPPQPSEDYEWNAATSLWQLKAAVVEKKQKRTAALARIAQLEVSQHRAIREYVLGVSSATDRLKAINDEIAGLRADLT